MDTTKTRVYVGRFPCAFTLTLLLMRARLRMARETADDVVRARGRVTTVDDDQYRDEVPQLDELSHGILRLLWKGDGEVHESAYVNGKVHGISRWWHQSGTIDMEFLYVNGVRHGHSRMWRVDGSLRQEDVYEHGEILFRREFPVKE